MSELKLFLRHNHLALAGVIILGIMLLAVLVGPLLLKSPIQIDMAEKLMPPSATHPLGTDSFGRDMLARVLSGGRYTLSIGIVIVAIAFAIGVFFGILAGFCGGWIDTIIMRVVDAILSFPALVLAIALSAAIGPSLQNAMIAVAITMAPQFARVARSQALAVSTRLYVEAATALGLSRRRILLRYVLINSIGPLLVQASLNVGSAILQTSALGFLGLGAQPPMPEWGADVSANLAYARSSPWTALGPGVAILLTVLAFNLLGDALADWFNPRRRSQIQ
ncbi:MAG TPA: ABC transporter permease [Paracoccus sp. (in: a-proteobacteria)]|uniref:ABC transporter permease n=1 Tax=Paracoccus sp. TaxID=267 RepID=UPI002CAFF122|nr:ABC transporter permease [Paracoccus sp. (in: a-proteobacteria)]HWL58412.1 ABC transporter permease [Paracoccus sp. (in: a-proteobacteria)]